MELLCSGEVWALGMARLRMFSHTVAPGDEVGNLVCATGAGSARLRSNVSSIVKWLFCVKAPVCKRFVCVKVPVCKRFVSVYHLNRCKTSLICRGAAAHLPMLPNEATEDAADGFMDA